MANRWQRFWTELRENRKRRKDKPALDVTADGFVFTRRDSQVSVHWGNVTEIAAGTRAMLSCELFYAAISDGGHVLEIDEFADGFNAFEAAVVERWPSLRTQWFALQKAADVRDVRETLWKSGDAR